MAAISCPFLNKIPIPMVRQHAPTLLGMIDKCPFMSTVHRAASTSTQNRDDKKTPEGDLRCPFLRAMPEVVKPKEATELGIQATTVEYMKPFNYDMFAQQRIDEKKRDHSYRVFRRVNRIRAPPEADEETVGAVTVWCSNDYLGMSAHPTVRQAATDAINSYGTGSGGTRNIAGTSSLHVNLEKELASWHKKDAAALFANCFMANQTALTTLGRILPRVEIFSDAGNHASLIEGVRASYKTPRHVFRHNDPAHLDAVLSKAKPGVPKIVAFETVHSMSGAVCPLDELCDVAHSHGALTFIDEVHAVGLYGEEGAGIGERDGQLGKMDLISGTLGKAVGSYGGYIVGGAAIIDLLRSYAPGFIFTTSLPPPVLEASRASIQLLRSEEGLGLRMRHEKIVSMTRQRLLEEGMSVMLSPSHIVPVKVGDPEKCATLSQRMLERHRIYVQSINYPTVARGEERLRIAPTPHHTPAMVEHFVQALREEWLAAGLQLNKDYDRSAFEKAELRARRVFPKTNAEVLCQAN